MGALSDLLKSGRVVATPATPATQPSAGVQNEPVSQLSQMSQGVEAEILPRLLALAEAEGVAVEIVHRLPGDELAACVGYPDDVLRGYVRALALSARLALGLVPPDWRTPAECAGCGPVWLWEGLPPKVQGCPWCFRRKAGNAIPRPPVQCAACKHYRPDPLNPDAGIGGCGVTGKPAQYPMRSHVCPIFQTKPTADQGVSS